MVQDPRQGDEASGNVEKVFAIKAMEARSEDQSTTADEEASEWPHGCGRWAQEERRLPG